MKTEYIENRAYIARRVHKHNNKNTKINEIRQKHTKHTAIYTMLKINQKNIKECDKHKSRIGSKL
jgi:hypothetical protein